MLDRENLIFYQKAGMNGVCHIEHVVYAHSPSSSMQFPVHTLAHIHFWPQDSTLRAFTIEMYTKGTAVRRLGTYDLGSEMPRPFRQVAEAMYLDYLDHPDRWIPCGSHA